MTDDDKGISYEDHGWWWHGINDDDDDSDDDDVDGSVRVEWWLTDDGLAPMADSFQSANFVKTEIFHNAAAARTLCY